VSINPLDDISLRASVVMIAIIANPHAIAEMCRETDGMSPEARTRIIRGIEKKERLRLARRDKAPKKKPAAARGSRK
jgi:hypothetical protein